MSACCVWTTTDAFKWCWRRVHLDTRHHLPWSTAPPRSVTCPPHPSSTPRRPRQPARPATSTTRPVRKVSWTACLDVFGPSSRSSAKLPLLSSSIKVGLHLSETRHAWITAVTLILRIYVLCLPVQMAVAWVWSSAAFICLLVCYSTRVGRAFSGVCVCLFVCFFDTMHQKPMQLWSPNLM